MIKFSRHPEWQNLIAVNVRRDQMRPPNIVVRLGHNVEAPGDFLGLFDERSADATLFITRDLVETSCGSIADVTAELLRGFAVLGYLDESLLSIRLKSQ